MMGAMIGNKLVMREMRKVKLMVSGSEAKWKAKERMKKGLLMSFYILQRRG